MRKVLPFLFPCLLAFAAPSFAQTSTPQLGVFGGYSYFNADTNGLTDRQSANGFESGLTVAPYRYAAAEVDFSGYFKNNLVGSGINATDFAVAAGPRFFYRQFFVHVLFGIDRLSLNEPSFFFPFSSSDTSFALVEGGGAQQRIAPHLAVRASVDWVITHHNLFGGSAVDQNNVRVGAGLVFTFGGAREASRVTTSQPRAVSAPQSRGQECGTRSATARAVTLSDIGLNGDANSLYGFRVTAVTPNGPADRAGIAVGDYVVSVNCGTVRTAAEILDGLGHATGTAIIAVNRPGWLPDQMEIRRLQVSP